MLKQFRALSCLGNVLLAAASSPQAQPPQSNLIPRGNRRIAQRKWPGSLCPLFLAGGSGSMQYRFSTMRTRTASSTPTSWGSPARVWALRIMPKGISGPEIRLGSVSIRGRPARFEDHHNLLVFFFHETATPELYTLSLLAALR